MGNHGGVKMETLLPLGKLDPGLRAPDVPLDIARFGEGAALTESLGYDAVLVEETKHDPYQCLALGAAATTTVGLGTSVAMAFPRSPTITAMSAWSLQQLVRRPVRVRARLPGAGAMCGAGSGWSGTPRGRGCATTCWQSGRCGRPGRTARQLDFHSNHYDLTLMVPLFDPGPIEWPNIPIHMRGDRTVDVRGGRRGRRRYSAAPDLLAPLHRRGDPACGGPGCGPRGPVPSEVEVCMKPLVGTAAGRGGARVAVTEVVRSRVAFYLSTPAYRRAFEIHGWGELADRAALHSKAADWDHLTALVDDEVLHTIATVGTHDTIGAQLRERYASRVDRIEFSIPVTTPRTPHASTPSSPSSRPNNIRPRLASHAPVVDARIFSGKVVDVCRPLRHQVSVEGAPPSTPTRRSSRHGEARTRSPSRSEPPFPRSANAVYELVSDITRMAEFSPETVAATWLGDADQAVAGARFKGTNAIGKLRWSTKPTVTAADPSRRFSFKVPGRFGATWVVSLRIG